MNKELTPEAISWATSLLRGDSGYGEILCEYCEENGLPVPQQVFPTEFHLVDADLIAEFEASQKFAEAMARQLADEAFDWEWWGQ